MRVSERCPTPLFAGERQRLLRVHGEQVWLGLRRTGRPVGTRARPRLLRGSSFRSCRGVALAGPRRGPEALARRFLGPTTPQAARSDRDRHKFDVDRGPQQFVTALQGRLAGHSGPPLPWLQRLQPEPSARVRRNTLSPFSGIPRKSVCDHFIYSPGLV